MVYNVITRVSCSNSDLFECFLHGLSLNFDAYALEIDDSSTLFLRLTLLIEPGYYKKGGVHYLQKIINFTKSKKVVEEYIVESNDKESESFEERRIKEFRGISNNFIFGIPLNFELINTDVFKLVHIFPYENKVIRFVSCFGSLQEDMYLLDPKTAGKNFTQWGDYTSEIVCVENYFLNQERKDIHG